MMQIDSSRPPPTVERRRYDNRTPTLDMSDRRIADMIGSVAIGAPSENYDQKPRKRPTARFGHPSARLLTCIASSCTKCTKAIYRPWNRGWTIETTSSIFSVLSLANPVTTLVAHQDKPQPNWPQLISINSIVSLFSLPMRTGASMVLAEGM